MKLAEMYRDGIGTEKDLDVASKLLMESSEAGISGAAFDLINLFVNGDLNDSELLERTISVTERIAKNGDVDAMNRLADMHLNGICIERDAQKAKQWYKMASDAGNPWSKQMYFNIS